MQRVIILIPIIFLYANWSLGQTGYVDSLLSFEHKIYESPENKRDSILLQKLNFMIQSDSIYSGALNEVKRIAYRHLPDSTAKRFLWNACIIAYVNQDADRGLIYWKRYRQLTSDSSMASLEMGYLFSQYKDTALHFQLLEKLAIRDTLFLSYEQISSQAIMVKGKGIKRISSFLVPGSGLMINGNPGKGLLSLGINSGVIFFIRYLVLQHAWLNGILWGSNLAGKFYFGGIRLLEKEMTTKEWKKKEKRAQESAQILEQLLVRYPIEFR